MTTEQLLKEARELLEKLAKERGGTNPQTSEVIEVAKMLRDEK